MTESALIRAKASAKLQRQPSPQVLFHFEQFAPWQAAEITGANQPYQATLRSRGVLKSSGSGPHNRFDIFALSYLLALCSLSDRGGPKAVQHVARIAALGIAWHALGANHAYSGDAERVLTWDRSLAPHIESFNAATSLLRHNNDWSLEEALAEYDRVAATLDRPNVWEQQSRWLQQAIFIHRQCAQKEPIPRLCVWYANGDYGWADHQNEPFIRFKPDDPRVIGPVVFLDQQRLGRELVRRTLRATGRPLVRVEIKS